MSCLTKTMTCKCLRTGEPVLSSTTLGTLDSIEIAAMAALRGATVVRVYSRSLKMRSNIIDLKSTTT